MPHDSFSTQIIFIPENKNLIKISRLLIKNAHNNIQDLGVKHLTFYTEKKLEIL